MKRALFQNVKIIPGGNDMAIDRKGYLSAVFAVTLDAVSGDPTGTAVTVEITHSDTEDGTFEPLEDIMAGLDVPMELMQGKGNGMLRPIPIQQGKQLILI